MRREKLTQPPRADLIRELLGLYNTVRNASQQLDVDSSDRMKQQMTIDQHYTLSLEAVVLGAVATHSLSQYLQAHPSNRQPAHLFHCLPLLSSPSLRTYLLISLFLQLHPSGDASLFPAYVRLFFVLECIAILYTFAAPAQDKAVEGKDDTAPLACVREALESEIRREREAAARRLHVMEVKERPKPPTNKKVKVASGRARQTARKALNLPLHMPFSVPGGMGMVTGMTIAMETSTNAAQSKQHSTHSKYWTVAHPALCAVQLLRPRVRSRVARPPRNPSPLLAPGTSHRRPSRPASIWTSWAQPDHPQALLQAQPLRSACLVSHRERGEGEGG